MKKDTERFLTLPATVISDALEKMGLAGAVGNLLEVSKVPRVAGRAVTMKLEPSNAPSRVHLGAKAIKAATMRKVTIAAAAPPTNHSASLVSSAVATAITARAISPTAVAAT